MEESGREEWRGEQKAGEEASVEGVTEGSSRGETHWAGLGGEGEGRTSASSFSASLLPASPPFSSPLISFTSLN